MSSRSKFNQTFWIGNLIEVLERFAYYGLYMGFSIYATSTLSEGGLGLTKLQLGNLQTIFLLLSYTVPLISGILADREGFKKMLIISYLIYLPGFILLAFTQNFIFVTLIMCLIAVAAGVFKPLIAGTVRLTTDDKTRTLGFGIFYLMVNVGAFFGPMTAGALRTKSWNYAFIASAIAVVAMIIVTFLWYKDPIDVKKAKQNKKPLTSSIKEILPLLADPKILVFIIIFGIFIEIPFWSFFNLVTLFVDEYVKTHILYDQFLAFFSLIGMEEFGKWFLGIFSTVETINGQQVHRIAGETLGHTALYIIIFQMLVTRTTEKMRSIPTVALGIILMVVGCVGLFLSTGDFPLMVFIGIAVFAIGEMACMPRFEQYLISLLPPEKTGLGGGLLRIPVAVGAFSGVTITPLFGFFEKNNRPEHIWLVLGWILVAGYFFVLIYDKKFKHHE